MKIAFLGDSITQGGCASSEENTYVSKVGEMLGCTVLNYGVSGTRIAPNSNPEDKYGEYFLMRAKKMDRSADFVFVFGGTNDSWCGATLGEIKLSDWEENDLFKVLPAICYFAYTLKKDLPNVEIVFVINTELKEEIVNCIEIASKVYNFKVVRLENITKENGHPTTQGMVEISKQVIKALV